MDTHPCPACGMERMDWPNPAGYVKEGQVYCCRGCAEGTGCTCDSAKADLAEESTDRSP